jgi:hypothetical protein
MTTLRSMTIRSVAGAVCRDVQDAAAIACRANYAARPPQPPLLRGGEVASAVACGIPIRGMTCVADRRKRQEPASSVDAASCRIASGSETRSKSFLQEPLLP